MTIEVKLFGSGGQRSFTAQAAPAPVTPTAPVRQQITLTREGLQRLLNQMPHRWYNAGELVIELSCHGIQTNHAVVTALLENCDVETRTKGKWTEYRRYDKKASEVHRRSCFACMNELKPHLGRRGVTTRELWDSLKKEFHVTSRSELDTPQWASISAMLQAAKRDLHLLNVLIQRVKRERG